jgi:hypothetical protein
VAAGLDDLERWLGDLLRRGLAALPAEGYGLWERPAARLVDAQARGLAHQLRQAGQLVGAAEGWPDRLLERLSSLHLLLEAYRRLDQLSAPLQADVRDLIGWNQSQEELLTDTGLVDRWLVVGQRSEREEQLRVRSSWLLGLTSRRVARLLDFAHGQQPFGELLVAGQTLQAELVFYPSAAPLRALIKQRQPSPPANALPGATTVLAAIAGYAAALARQPWLTTWPLVLAAVTPLPSEEGWAVRDAAGHQLPLVPRYQPGWTLLALSGGRPLDLFGEWDGTTLLPLGVWSEEGFHGLEAGGQPLAAMGGERGAVG